MTTALKKADPHGVDGTTDYVATKDINVELVLCEILTQLTIMNRHLSILSDEDVKQEDLGEE